jgi:hypothetical protein
VNAVRVPWSSASFLVYLGGITILFAVATLLTLEGSEHGAGRLVLWATLVFLGLSAAAFAAKQRGHQVTAGLLALSAVAAFLVFFGALLDWFGWLSSLDEDSVFGGFRFWFLVLQLAVVVAAAVALRIFRFPLLTLFVAAGSWFFVTDLISNGGNWSAIATIAFGLVLLLAGIAVDDGPSRPFGFWLHIVAGLTIGGGLLWFFHDGGFDWVLVAVFSFLYIAIGDRLMRSSWVVFGGWGLLQVASYFATKWSDQLVFLFFFGAFYLFPFAPESFDESGRNSWAGPLVFAVTGAVFIGIALYLARRRRDAIPAAELL